MKPTNKALLYFRDYPFHVDLENQIVYDGKYTNRVDQCSDILRIMLPFVDWDRSTIKQLSRETKKNIFWYDKIGLTRRNETTWNYSDLNRETKFSRDLMLTLVRNYGKVESK